MRKNFRGNNMKEICGICHKETVPIEVHGHTQCSHCGGNYSPCCQGEQAMPINKMPEDSLNDLVACIEKEKNEKTKVQGKGKQHDAHVKTWEAHRRKFGQSK